MISHLFSKVVLGIRGGDTKAGGAGSAGSFQSQTPQTKPVTEVSWLEMGGTFKLDSGAGLIAMFASGC